MAGFSYVSARQSSFPWDKRLVRTEIMWESNKEKSNEVRPEAHTVCVCMCACALGTANSLNRNRQKAWKTFRCTITHICKHVCSHAYIHTELSHHMVNRRHTWGKKKGIEEGEPRGPSGVWPYSKGRYDTNPTNPHTDPFPLQLALNINHLLLDFSMHRKLQTADWVLILNPTKSKIKPLLAPIIQILIALKIQHWTERSELTALLLPCHSSEDICTDSCQDSLPEGQMRRLFWEAWEIGGIYIMCVRSH